MHIKTEVPVGEIQYKAQGFMASSDWIKIVVNGKGAHGSKPWTGVDPIAASAQIIQGLQNIVSRQMELTKAPVVITIGAIHGGVRNNIIPESCEMIGTLRTLDPAMQKELHKYLKRRLNGTTNNKNSYKRKTPHQNGRAFSFNQIDSVTLN